MDVFTVPWEYKEDAQFACYPDMGRDIAWAYLTIVTNAPQVVEVMKACVWLQVGKSMPESYSLGIYKMEQFLKEIIRAHNAELEENNASFSE